MGGAGRGQGRESRRCRVREWRWVFSLGERRGVEATVSLPMHRRCPVGCPVCPSSPGPSLCRPSPTVPPALRVSLTAPYWTEAMAPSRRQRRLPGGQQGLPRPPEHGPGLRCDPRPSRSLSPPLSSAGPAGRCPAQRRAAASVSEVYTGKERVCVCVRRAWPQVYPDSGPTDAGRLLRSQIVTSAGSGHVRPSFPRVTGGRAAASRARGAGVIERAAAAVQRDGL